MMVISHLVICQLFLTLFRLCNHQLFSHTKTAAIYPRKHLGLIVWRVWAQGPCDVCHADLSPSCTPPSLFIIGPRHASGICGIFPSLYISTANLTNFGHVRQCRLCGLSALQSDRQNKLSLNQWIYGWWGNWEFPYGLWWNDKILSTGLWGGQNGEIIRYPRGTCHLLDNLIIHLSLCLVEWSFWIKWGEMDCPLNVNY